MSSNADEEEKRSHTNAQQESQYRMVGAPERASRLDDAGLNSQNGTIVVSQVEPLLRLESLASLLRFLLPAVALWFANPSLTHYLAHRSGPNSSKCRKRGW